MENEVIWQRLLATAVVVNWRELSEEEAARADGVVTLTLFVRSAVDGAAIQPGAPSAASADEHPAVVSRQSLSPAEVFYNQISILLGSICQAYSRDDATSVMGHELVEVVAMIDSHKFRDDTFRAAVVVRFPFQSFD